LGGFDHSRAGVFDEIVEGLIDSADVAAEFRRLSAEIAGR